MLRTFLLSLSAAACLSAAQPKAKNIILFLGDAGGIPTLHAASVYAHNDPQKLFLQSFPYIGLSDTSAATQWVTDSAAGMTAIVTGTKTKNGMLSLDQDGKTDLKTILEYAEEKGLSTGVISNMDITDATPAACYSHVPSRKGRADVFAQLLKPRFGDGPDVIIGAGRKQILTATSFTSEQMVEMFQKAKYTVLDSLEGEVPQKGRVVGIFDSGAFDPVKALNIAISILSKNPKGYFLMFEWDMHTTKMKLGLDHVIEMDRTIQQAASRVGNDTLLMFTADHSFDFRTLRGNKGDAMLVETPDTEAKPKMRVSDGHTGEQVLVAAKGPGADKVHGYLRNTDLFGIMMSAYGWK